MKRNMDLVRAVLLEIEAKDEPDQNMNLRLEEYSKAEIEYHLTILEEAKLIALEAQQGWHNNDIYPQRLTWEGHDFLDAARDEGRWEQAKEIVKEKGGGLSLDVVKALLIQLAKQAVGLD